MPGNILITNYLGKIDILCMDKKIDRKYFNWKILNFYLRQKLDIEALIMIDTNRNQYTKIGINNSYKISKKDLSSLMSPEITPSNSIKRFFDWMGMNEKMLNCPVSNLELWFFPKFMLLYNAYETKSWVIPIKLLLLNLNKNENSSENKKINEKKKRSFLIALNKKHQNKEEKEPTNRGDLGPGLSQKKRY
ncbi:hypothetical protein ABFX02_01G101300 [Erythranthe guttata]